MAARFLRVGDTGASMRRFSRLKGVGNTSLTSSNREVGALDSVAVTRNTKNTNKDKQNQKERDGNENDNDKVVDVGFAYYDDGGKTDQTAPLLVKTLQDGRKLHLGGLYSSENEGLDENEFCSVPFDVLGIAAQHRRHVARLMESREGWAHWMAHE